MSATKNLDLQHAFALRYGEAPQVIASAPGRLEVLGNHTDYNAGLTLSCAVDYRCFAMLSPLDEPIVKLASTAFDTPPEVFRLDSPMRFARKGHWGNYILGLVAALMDRGETVPGFALMIDSAAPRSAGVSSSAAIEMATLTGLVQLMGLKLSSIEMARIGQWAESRVVGAQTGLLDQLTSLMGQQDALLFTDFQTLASQAIALPTGFVFVVIDSGVKHNLTTDYNDRRTSCEMASKAMGVRTLREATAQMLASHRGRMADDAYRCATHILGENQRVQEAVKLLEVGEIEPLGQRLFDSHESSRLYSRAPTV